MLKIERDKRYDKRSLGRKGRVITGPNPLPEPRKLRRLHTCKGYLARTYIILRSTTPVTPLKGSAFSYPQNFYPHEILLFLVGVKVYPFA